MAEPPVYIEPKIGWRTWWLERDQNPDPGDWSRSPRSTNATKTPQGPFGRVAIASGGGVWPRRQKLVAECRGGRGNHDAPALNCTCGIYAARSLEDLRDLGYAADPDTEVAPDLMGELWMWGRIEEQPSIWRAQYALPKKLYLPHIHWRWAKPLQRAYGVEIEISNVFTMEG